MSFIDPSVKRLPVRIAVLDPVMRTREYGRRVVRRLGHEPVAFAGVDEFARALAFAQEFDMIWVAAAGDAAAVAVQVQEIKALLGERLPMLCLASRRQLPDLADRHWNAADELIAGPTSFLELCCIARMFLRRFGVHVPESEPAWGCYRFSLMSDVVEVSGERVHLRPVEFDLALELFRHAGRMLTRDWLYSVVWNKGEDTQSRTLDIGISRLRRALSLEANGWDLRAVWRSGYRLDGPAAREAPGRVDSGDFNFS